MNFLRLTTLSTVLIVLMSGCNTTTPSPKKQVVIDDTLPVITMTKNGVIADSNAIALEWQSIDDQRVEGIYIYKNIQDGKNTPEIKHFDTITNRFATHYLDTKVEPNLKYNYYFKTFSLDAESKKSQDVVISTLPQIESVSWIHSLQNMPRSTKILWRPHASEKTKAYIIQRKMLDESNWTNIATIDGRLNVEYIDKNLKDKSTYVYRIQVLTYDGQLSKPSQEVAITTKALPNEIKNIVATKNQPKKIEISWDKSDSKDFLVYRIYRSSSSDSGFKMLADTINTKYVDNIDEDAKEYFYRVSVFDRDKLSSVNTNHTAMGQTLIKPSAPSIIEAKFIGDAIKLTWTNSDPRVKGYLVRRTYKKSFLENEIEDIEGIKSSEFLDDAIKPNGVYIYKVYALDEHGVLSISSTEARVETLNFSKRAEVKQVQKDKEVVRKTQNPEPKIEKKPQTNKSQESGADKSIVIPLEDLN